MILNVIRGGEKFFRLRYTTLRKEISVRKAFDSHFVLNTMTTWISLSIDYFRQGSAKLLNIFVIRRISRFICIHRISFDFME